jgi:cytochrome c
MSPHNSVHLWRIISSAMFFLISVSGASAGGDTARGAIVFRQCQDCHATNKGVNKEGPSLYRVIGRPAGSMIGYAYSDAMKASAFRGLIWTADNVVKYLANPHQFFVNYLGAPDARNKMIFKLVNEQDREDVVAYLRSLATE